jgi:hypothetical protein
MSAKEPRLADFLGKRVNVVLNKSNYAWFAKQQRLGLMKIEVVDIHSGYVTLTWAGEEEARKENAKAAG